jgi:hypothetical protein
MKKFLIAFLFLPFLTDAQDTKTDTLKLKASLSLTGFWQSGNVETLIFRAKADLSYRFAEKWVYRTRNSYLYQEFGNEKADEDILSLNFLSFSPDRKTFPLVLGFFSSNFRRAIDGRYLIGAGLTHKIIEGKDNWLKFSVTSEYEETQFSQDQFNLTEYNGSQIISTVRGTLWLNGYHPSFNKKMIVKHESYFQPSLERSNNYRWQVDLGLEFPLIKYLNFKVSYLHTFESIVIESQQQEDQFVTLGFTIKNF